LFKKWEDATPAENTRMPISEATRVTDAFFKTRTPKLEPEGGCSKKLAFVCFSIWFVK
jgi:hypothetical protein